MAKKTIEYVCEECGAIHAKFAGRCRDCRSWNCLVEREKIPESKGAQRASIGSSTTYTKPKKIIDIETKSQEDRLLTGIGEFDRVLGGGVVTDSVVILSAEPGTGKSTILLQSANNIASTGKTVLYYSGEESESQIKSRGIRLFGDKLAENIYIKSSNSMDELLISVKDLKPDLLIVDSIQTFSLTAFEPSRAGGGVQVTECTNALISVAKTMKIPTFIVGQVTKDNELAGVRYLEHAVDAVLYLQGDKNLQLRIMSCKKNRFGSTEEIGLFEMTSYGLKSIENPNELFLTKREAPVAGCALMSITEGSRSFVVEVQSLVTACAYGLPSRNALGLNKDYVRILCNMLEARTKISMSSRDVSLQVTGGLYVKDVAANLGIIMSIVSSCVKEPIPESTVFIGEVGLTGEITNVQYLAARIKAIDRYGFKQVYVPKGALSETIKTENVKIIEVGNLQETIKSVFSTT